MNRGRGLNEIKEQIERERQLAYDIHVPTPLLNSYYDESSNMVIHVDSPEVKENDFKVTNIAHGQLADKLSIPRTYYNRMAANNPNLLLDNINSWFVKQPETRFMRTLGKSMRAFLSNAYKPIDNFLIGDFIIPFLESIEGLEVKSSELTDTRLYIQAVSTRLTDEVAVGDEVQAGIVISNSEIGMGRLKVEFFMYFLKCLNGMIGNELVSKTHLGKRISADAEGLNEFTTDRTKRLEDEALMSGLRDLVDAALVNDLYFTKQMNKLRLANKNPITAPIARIIDVTRKHYGMTEGESEKVSEKLSLGGNFTRYGLSAAVTNLAGDLENYDRTVDLEKIGGNIIEMPYGTWKQWNGDEGVA